MFVKKWLIFTATGLVVISGATWYGFHAVKQEVGKQVVTILSDPSTQNKINHILSNATGTQTGLASTNSTSTTPENSATSTSGGGSQEGSSSGKTNSGGATKSSDAPHFTSRQQVVDYAMSHFTKTEIAHYTQLYMNRSSLTQKQKDDIKAEILSHFTPAEIQAMGAAAKKYQ